MQKTEAKTSPVQTRTLHVPVPMHRAIVKLAADRDESIQEVVTKALEVALPELARTIRSN